MWNRMGHRSKGCRTMRSPRKPSACVKSLNITIELTIDSVVFHWRRKTNKQRKQPTSKTIASVGSTWAGSGSVVERPPFPEQIEVTSNKQRNKQNKKQTKLLSCWRIGMPLYCCPQLGLWSGQRIFSCTATCLIVSYLFAKCRKCPIQWEEAAL